MSIFTIRHQDGSTEGADPRDLTPAALMGAGHEKRPILRTIREKCIDCSGGSPAEVRRCTAEKCPLWPYRMGTNPFSINKGHAINFAREAVS